MAGGMTFPDQRFNVPHSKAGSGSLGINGVDRNGNPVTPTPAQLGLPSGGSMLHWTAPMFHQAMADAMPAEMYGYHSDADPVGYLRQFGLTLTHPDMATYIDGNQARGLVHAYVQESGRTSRSTGRTAMTTVHASSDQRRPEHSRVSATYSPFEHEGGLRRAKRGF